MTERKSLESERAEWVALADNISTHLKHGTSPVLWSKDMELIVTALRTFAAQDQKPVAFDECCATGRSCEYGSHGYNGEQQCQYCGKAEPPKAAGWNEAIGALRPFAEAEYDLSEKEPDAASIWETAVANDITHGDIRRAKKAYDALRHNAPPDTGVGKSAPPASDPLPSGERVGTVLPPRGGADAGVRKVLERILTAAKLLQQNAVGCAINHYGHDCELNGLPGWLIDAQNDIDAAEVALASVEVPKPVYKAVERILDEKSAWIARPNDEVTKSIALQAVAAAHKIIAESCSTCGGEYPIEATLFHPDGTPPRGGADAEAVDPRWRTELDEIISHLGAAVMQSTPSDDQIIMDHVKVAHELAKVVRRQT